MASKRLFWVLAAVFLQTPVAQAAENYIVGDAALGKSSVQFVDSRPAKELKGGLPLFFDPTYSIPDKRFTPLLLDVFGAALEQKFGPEISGKTISIEHFQVQNYFRKTYEKNQAVSAFITAGAAGAVLAAIDGKELIDAVRIAIEGSIGGQKFKVSHAQAYAGKSCGGMIYNCQPSREATKAIVEQGVAMAVEEVGKLLDPGALTQPTPSE